MICDTLGHVLARVAFDLDDTLCDWETGIDNALAHLCDTETGRRFRLAVQQHAWHRVNGSILSRRHWMTRRDPAFFWAQALPHADREEVARISEEYLKRLDLPLFVDAIETLDLVGEQARLALLSNAPRALDRARSVGILDRFEVALSAPADRMKPHPAAFTNLLTELDLVADEVAYVGDDPTEDVEGALNSGLTPVWLDRIQSDWTPPAGVLRITALKDLPTALGL